MKALLEIVGGTGQVGQHWVEPGTVIGRKKGTLLLEDPRVSSKHADIINDNGELYIRDLKSTHGLWSSAGRMGKLKLVAGTSFQMGDTKIRVLRVEQTDADKILSDLLAALKTSQAIPQEAAPFPTVLLLEFLQGPHTGEIWPLGYGPRVVGTASLDLLIYDPEAKEECFRLESRDRQVVLTSPHEHFVKVNNQYTQETTLQPNDLVAFGETLIKVTAQATKP